VSGHFAGGKLVPLPSPTPSAASSFPSFHHGRGRRAGCESVLWFGLEAPVGTPQPIIDKLNRAANEAVKSDEVVSSLKAQDRGGHGGTPDDFARHLAAEQKRWTKVVETAGLRK
jgi:hypothetical protein